MEKSINSDPVQVALASEDNYFCGLLVTGASIAHFAAASADLCFTILDCGISNKNFQLFESIIREQHGKTVIRRLVLSEADFRCFPDWHGNKAAYARLKLPELLKDISHIIYCDCDFLWIADIAKLWGVRNKNIPLFSTRDLNQAVKKAEQSWYRSHGLEVNIEKYFCSGLSFFNLELFRKQGLSRKAIEFVLAHPDLGSADQTALNAVLNGTQSIVNQSWQRFSRDSPIETLVAPMALHYAGDVPWKISKRSHMLTDVQLLWFRFNASIRRISLWQSLRLHYSAFDIIFYRITFKTIMCVPFFRWAFNLMLSKTGRWGFYERMGHEQFKQLMHLLTF